MFAGVECQVGYNHNDPQAPNYQARICTGDIFKIEYGPSILLAGISFSWEAFEAKMIAWNGKEATATMNFDGWNNGSGLAAAVNFVSPLGSNDFPVVNFYDPTYYWDPYTPPALYTFPKHAIPAAAIAPEVLLDSCSNLFWAVFPWIPKSTDRPSVWTEESGMKPSDYPVYWRPGTPVLTPELCSPPWTWTQPWQSDPCPFNPLIRTYTPAYTVPSFPYVIPPRFSPRMIIDDSENEVGWGTTNTLGDSATIQLFVGDKLTGISTNWDLMPVLSQFSTNRSDIYTNWLYMKAGCNFSQWSWYCTNGTIFKTNDFAYPVRYLPYVAWTWGDDGQDYRRVDLLLAMNRFYTNILEKGVLSNLYAVYFFAGTNAYQARPNFINNQFHLDFQGVMDTDAAHNYTNGASSDGSSGYALTGLNPCEWPDIKNTNFHVMVWNKTRSSQDNQHLAYNRAWDTNINDYIHSGPKLNNGAVQFYGPFGKAGRYGYKYTKNQTGFIYGQDGKFYQNGDTNGWTFYAGSGVGNKQNLDLAAFGANYEGSVSPSAVNLAGLSFGKAMSDEQIKQYFEAWSEFQSDLGRWDANELNPQFWFDATYQTNTVDGSSMLNARDSGSVGYQAVAVNGYKAPYYYTNVKNGKPSMFFWKLRNQYFYSSSISSTNKEFTMWAVVSPGEEATVMTMLGSYPGGAGWRLNSGYQQLLKSGDSSVIGTGNTSHRMATWYILAVTYDQSGNYKFYSNGQVDGYGTNNKTFSSTQGNYTGIGNQVDSTTESFSGHMPDVGKVNRVLSESELKRLFKYLNAKWAVY